MSTLLCNISASELNLFHGELMLICATVNLLGFFDLFLTFEHGSRFNSAVKIDKVLYLIKMSRHFQSHCHLSRYDTIGTCRWNCFKFSWVLRFRKIYFKIRFKNRGSLSYFSVLEVKYQKYYKNWTNETVFIYIICFIFYWISHAKTDAHNKYLI